MCRYLHEPYISPASTYILFNLDGYDNTAADRLATQNAVQHAMNHPVDPRTYSRSVKEQSFTRNPFVPAAQSSQPHLVGSQWDEVSKFHSPQFRQQ